MSVGYRRGIEAAVGWTLRHDEAAYGPTMGDLDATAHDFGILTRWPVLRNKQLGRGVRPFLTPMLGYAMTNFGSKMIVQNHDAPLARMGRLSLAISAGLTKELRGEPWQMLSLEWARQEQVGLLDGDEHYQNPFGRMQPLDDLIFGGFNESAEVHRGFEAGLAEVLYVRWGAIKNYGQWSSHDQIKTSGFTVQLGGLLKMARGMEDMPGEGTMADLLLRHLDLAYHESRWEERMDGDYWDYHAASLDGVVMRSVTLSWK